MLGLDIGSESIRLVELSKGLQGWWQLERYASEPLKAQWISEGYITALDEVADALKRLLKKSGTKAKTAALALPDTAVITKTVTLPRGLSEDELSVQVDAEASQFIPFDLDEVSIDFSILGPTPNNPDDDEVFFAATRKDRVEDRQLLAQLAGLQPVVIDVQSYANRLMLHHLQQVQQQAWQIQEEELLALLKIGSNGYFLQVLRGSEQEVVYDSEQALGGQRLSELIAQYYDLSLQEAEQKKHHSAQLPADYASAVLAPFLESLAQDIYRALQFFFTSTGYSQVQHIALFGGSASLEGLTQAVQRHTGAVTTLLNPFAGMQLGSSIQPSRLRQEAASYFTACGLALRRFYR